ncbi:GntR family transcriptional regulator [Bradyrhizobium manausense]|uniref:GntR family transcriptional regulator n=1 Tax=Bradyrhizobium manausense TaxID=989370 RepID=UPI001BA6EB53|nr:GntR family transcriptional regulator [Bradyrhizobium manausense]MBR0725513.1 GntR family transcriptional regulator [Bradyrhizobium manausense]
MPSSRHSRGGATIASSGDGARKSKTSLKQAAYNEIRRLIVTLQFAPGERVNEQIVSERIGIGKTPVRQALQMLSTQGLVQIIPRKGIRIVPDTLHDALSVLEARSAIEGELARFAAQRADPKILDQIEQNLSSSRRALKQKDFEAFTRADRGFHEIVAIAAGNAILSETLNALHDRIARIWHLRTWKLDHLEKTQEEHTAVFRAIAARDADTAASAMRTHLDTLRKSIVDARIVT